MKKFFLLTTLLIFIDQIIKILIRSTLSIYETIVIVPKILNITYVQNTGAAFSMLEGKQIFLTIISVIVLIGMFYYIKKNKLDKLEYVIFSLIISGIIGNLIDRLLLNYVTDFIEFIILGKNMPIFNLADTFICVGFGLLIFKEEICKNLNMKTKKVLE